MTKSEAVRIAKSHKLPYIECPALTKAQLAELSKHSCTCGHSRRLHRWCIGDGPDRIFIPIPGHGGCGVTECTCEYFQEAKDGKSANATPAAEEK